MAARLNPAPSRPPEIVELRRLSARDLEPLLREETAAWWETLDWDFEKSADLVRRFVDLRALNGYALVEDGLAVGYIYYVLEEGKGLMGDLYVKMCIRDRRGVAPLLLQAVGFYRMQLHRHGEAVAYLHQRGLRSPELIEHMRIGYAPGGCLRGWLTQLGYPLPALRRAGLVTAAGYDAYTRRIVFPLEGNLYGRSLSDSAPPHRFLPGAKGGLYSWAQAQSYPDVILVEGLFDYAVLWEAGFRNVTCSLGTQLNALQFRQLCDGPRTVYLAFDADGNGSGQQAAQALSQSLQERGISTRLVSLPEDHDPNSFLVSGGDGNQFRSLLERAAR